jgi:hypothetical protein
LLEAAASPPLRGALSFQRRGSIFSSEGAKIKALPFKRRVWVGMG